MLSLDPDKVSYIIALMRERSEGDLLDASNPDDETDTEGEFDLAHEEAFDELDSHGSADNQGGDELETFISELAEDEQQELVALVWIGRTDYDADEWSDALEAAQERDNGQTATYLIGMPRLADYLEEGLEAFGHSYNS
ncbi:DUF3775 domain-containing protein [Rhodovibrionaceae bacterium A322]